MEDVTIRRWGSNLGAILEAACSFSHTCHFPYGGLVSNVHRLGVQVLRQEKSDFRDPIPDIRVRG